MIKILLSAGMILAASVAFAQLTPAENASSVSFKIKNLGIEVEGSFKGLVGKINFDPLHLQNSSFDVTIDANTVNTDNSMRDDHLRKESYFDVVHYKTIHLVSAKVTASPRKGIYVFFGKLTIKNTTKDITFPFTCEAQGGGYVFKGSFKMNRRDFDVGGASITSDELQVFLTVTAK